jgi:uncharacterized membrane protein YcaP (DUF421 family)
MWEWIFDYIITPILVFVGGYIYLRIAGKKAVSEMNSFDLLFIVVMGTIVAEPLVSKDIARALLYGAAFMTMYIIFSMASLNNKLRWLLIASPTVLIRNGDIDEKGLRKVRMTVGELLSELRTKGYTKTADIELAVLEDMGKFSVIPKSDYRPIQPSDLNMVTSPAFIPIPVILDKQIIDHNLKYLKKDREWLEQQLKSHSLSMNQIDMVTLATVNQQGSLEVDLNSPNHNNQGPDAYKPGNQN